MANDTIRGSIPPLELLADMQIVLEAISPTTGAPAAGVKVTAFAIWGDDIHGAGGANTPLGPFLAVPGPEA